MNNIIRAGADDIIWLVVVIFWVVAQVAGAAAQKKKSGRRQQPREEDGNTPVDPFAELMRKLSGVQEFKVPHPKEEPDYPPEWNVSEESDRAPEQPWEPGEIETLPEIQPLQRKTPVTIEKVLPSKVAEVDIRPKMSAFRSSMPAMKMPVMNLRIGLPAYAESSKGRKGLGDELHLQNKKSLRRAMLSHIIFSPPRALE